MSEQDLIALIERLEKAQGPDHELDAEIWLTLHPEWRAYPRDDRDGQIGWTTRYGRAYLYDYTASIDAALTLVPEGWSWRVGSLPSGKSFADLGTQKSLQCIEGATAAIALCIAALKARQQP